MEHVGYLVSRYGAGIKMHDHADRARALDDALTQAAARLRYEQTRPPEVEEMTYTRERGWTNTGAYWRFHGPLREGSR